MTSIITIAASDQITNSRADLNTNFAALNTGKIETSVLDTDTTLAANSDAKIPSQKAVKAYVDAGGNVNASTTTRGIVEQATAAEVTARTTTGSTGAPLFVNPGDLGSLFTAAVVRTYSSPNAKLGDSTTRFDVTNTSGTTYRYTFDGTGTDPGITSVAIPTGSAIDIQGSNFNSANKGLFLVTSSGTNYFEITNASGVAENDKTLGTGYLILGTTWTKPSGLAYIVVQMVGAGAGGGGAPGSTDKSGGGGGAGGYLIKKIAAASLSSTEPLVVGLRGVGVNGTNGEKATDSAFSSTLRASGGSGGLVGTGNPHTSGGSGGAATGGDINLTGESGWEGLAISASAYISGKGGNSQLGTGGPASLASGATDATISDGAGYGSGGSAAAQDSNASLVTGGNGKSGIIMLYEYYV